MKQLITLIATCLFMVSSASAGLINYSEVGDGDLDGIAGTNLGLLNTAGNNIINGFWTATPGSDVDRFQFALGADLEILSITLSTTLENGEVSNSSVGFNPGNLFDDSFFGSGSLAANFMDTVGPDTGALGTATEGGVWDFFLIGSVMFNTTNWTTTIVTRSTGTPPPPPSVPEPSTLLIFSLGIIALISRKFN